MGNDQIYNYVPKCYNVLWSELDKNLKNNNLFVLTINADLITNLNIVRKRFTFIITRSLG